jgi:phosphoribosyl 1,2-cyclic phosphodiesterase
MRFRFWGVRGSIPSPGPATARYGGNTTCIEVRTDQGTLIVIDAGTGIFALAQQLPRDLPIQASIFITHSHWDHIHGLPFFTPLFKRGTCVRLHGAPEPVSGKGIEHVMAVQLQNSYFPVSEAQMAATIEYRTLAIGESVLVDDAVVSNAKSLFFTGDHEPHYNIYPQDDPRHAPFQQQMEARQRAIDAIVQGVDALIVDCSYTREEYPSKQGWGHGTFDAALAMALRSGARQLYCTHHEPTRGDAELESVFAEVMARHAPLPDGLQVFLAYEGLEVELHDSGPTP